jgi:hypothetical protein
MTWVTTFWVIAFVKNMQFTINIANQPRKKSRNSVSELWPLLFVKAKPTVALHERGVPLPAQFFIALRNFLPKPLINKSHTNLPLVLPFTAQPSARFEAELTLPPLAYLLGIIDSPV